MNNVIYYDDLILDLQIKMKERTITEREVKRFHKLMEWLNNDTK